MPPKKVARKVTQQRTEVPKRPRVEKKKGRKSGKKNGKGMVKASLTTTPILPAGSQNVLTTNTDECTKMEESHVSLPQSSLVNVSAILIDTILFCKIFI